MNKLTTILIAWMALLPVANACIAAAGGDEMAAVAPFVGNQTWLVAKADLAAVDLDAVPQWVERLADLPALKQFGPDSRAHLDAMTDRWRKWAAQFKKAGGSTIWAVVGIETDEPLPTIVLVVPLLPGSDEPALTGLLSAGDLMNVSHEKGALIARSPRTRAFPTRPQRRLARSELAEALEATGEAPLRIAIIPPADGRRVLESMLPPLPDGQPATVVTRGILHASIAIEPPPQAAGHLVLRSDDAASAQALQKFMTSLASLGSPDTRRWDAVPNFSQRALVAFFGELGRSSRVRDNQVVVDVGAAALGDLVSSLAARYELGLRVKSAMNIRMILQACFLYSNDRKDKQFPPSLEKAVDSPDFSPSVLINPRLPENKPGYVYIRPSEGSQVPAERLIVYEKFDHFGSGVNVGFGDGHVDFIAGEPEFNKLLESARMGAAK
jgi:prepilin-type processing-associated H-X9-DG protein